MNHGGVGCAGRRAGVAAGQYLGAVWGVQVRLDSKEQADSPGKEFIPPQFKMDY